MPHAPLTELALPCEQCGVTVTVRTDELGHLLDDWLDGTLTIRCALHRARNEPTAP